jgi:cell division protein DivIC
MQIIKFFNRKKFFLLNIFLALYIIINLTGGERGLFSYFEKKNIKNELFQKKISLTSQLDILDHKNVLLSEKIDLDYLDMLYRENLKYGNKEEILIKLK